MKPKNLTTKIFLDGGDPNETKEIFGILGFLDGQTTNPTLIAKNPEAKKRLEKGEKFTEEEITKFYRGVVEEISHLIPNGSISIEVYADQDTNAQEMFAQGREMFSWIQNAHIKYPITKEGLAAAARSIREDMRVNMTLCFTQEQAAAVYAATKGAKRGEAFVSPFIGRLDDRKENGMDLIKNIKNMLKTSDGHVEVLSASVRSIEHFLAALALGSDIITSPAPILKEWALQGMPIPDESYQYHAGDLKSIPYKEFDLSKHWQEFNITDELTDKGIDRFAQDWNALIAKE